MNNRDVIKALKFYKTIPSEINIRQDRIKELEDRYNTLGSVRLDGMPNIGHVCDQTGNAVIRMDSTNESALLDILGLEDEIRRLHELERFIFNCVKQLPYYQKMVTYRMYFDGWSLSKIAYNLHYSERQCRRFRDYAIKGLHTRFEQCPLMSGFSM